MFARSYRLMVILPLVLFSLVSCSRGKSEQVETSMRVDAKGGLVIAPDGASVEIPPDAVQDPIEISVTTYESVADMPAEYHSSLVGANGVADFGPDGTVFEKPVRITIPSPTPLTPGDEYQLYMWSSEETAWQETEFIATVDPEGNSYSAEVTHFTTYTGSVYPGPSYFWPLDNINVYVPDPETAFREWTGMFLSMTDRAPNQLWRIEDCCWEEVGLLFQYDFWFNGEQIFNGTRQVPEGGPANFDWREYVAKEVTNEGYGFAWTASVVIYWNSKAPAISLEPQQAALKLACGYVPNQTLTIFANCGEQAIPGAFIDISVESGPGSISPENLVTDASGEAIVAYSPDGDGIASIAGLESTCRQEPEPFRAEVDAEVCIEQCDGWDVDLRMDLHHSGADVSWIFRNTVSAIIPFEFDPETGVVTSEPVMAEQYLTVKPVDAECSIINQVAPGFKIQLVNASLVDGVLKFGILPDSTPLRFTWYCPSESGQEPFSYTVTAYSELAGSVIGKELEQVEMALECDGMMVLALDEKDKGSEGFGEFDIPIAYDYIISLDESCEEDTCKAYR